MEAFTFQNLGANVRIVRTKLEK